MDAKFGNAGMDRQQGTSGVRLRYATLCVDGRPVPFEQGDIGFRIGRSPSN